MRLRRSLHLAVLLGLAAFVSLFAGEAAASPGPYRILIAHSDGTAPAGLHDQIAAIPDVAAVDYFNVHTATPTAAQLASYDEVVSQAGDQKADDPSAYGNALADYYDQGGVVFQYGWDSDENPGYPTTGRWTNYEAFRPGAVSTGSQTLGVHDSFTPLFDGVNALAAFQRTAPSPAPGALVLARWGNMSNLAAVKGHTVSVSAYVGNDYGGPPGNWSGDFGRLTVNAVRWLSPQTLTVTKTGDGQGTVTSNPAGVSCGSVCAADFPGQQNVGLSAVAAAGSVFTGWSGGGCSGTGTCNVTMDVAKQVTAAFAKDRAAPKQLSLGFSRKTFRAAAKGGSIARKKKTPVGTTVRYKVSEAGKAKFTVERRTTGRKKGRKCVAPTKKNRKARHCVRYVRLKGSFSRPSKTGSNSFRFTGRLRGKKLRSGRYRLVMASTDAAGNKSKPKRASFRIVRR